MLQIAQNWNPLLEIILNRFFKKTSFKLLVCFVFTFMIASFRYNFANFLSVNNALENLQFYSLTLYDLIVSSIHKVIHSTNFVYIYNNELYTGFSNFCFCKRKRKATYRNACKLKRCFEIMNFQKTNFYRVRGVLLCSSH